MEVLVKFFCGCEGYVEELFNPDIEPVEIAGPGAHQLCPEVVMCQECYEVHELEITQNPDGKILVWVNDVDDWEYEVIPSKKSES